MNVVHSKNSENVMHIKHEIMKTRFVTDTKTGRRMTIGKPVRTGLHKISQSAGEFTDNMHANLMAEPMLKATRKTRCGSCYNAAADEVWIVFHCWLFLLHRSFR